MPLMNKCGLRYSEAEWRIIDVFKLLLIAGVVLCHCNLISDVSNTASVAGKDVIAFNDILLKVCVPSFFVISGFLFFKGLNDFSWSIYKSKLSRRVRSLLVPYLLWNIFCAALFVFKVEWLHFPGLGIIDVNGRIDIAKFLLGFVYIKEADGTPFAFAFWFIRNLMLVVFLTPAVYFIAKRWWSLVLFLVPEFMLGINLLEISWFVVGSALAIHGLTPNSICADKSPVFLVSGLLYFSFGWGFYTWETIPVASRLLLDIETVCGFIFLYGLAERIEKFCDCMLLRTLCSATFFIYAFHQCFCAVNRKFWISVFDCDKFTGLLGGYFASFLSLLSISFAVYIILKRIAPRFTGILTGGRRG